MICESHVGMGDVTYTLLEPTVGDILWWEAKFGEDAATQQEH
jgi:hypothetical protein